MQISSEKHLTYCTNIHPGKDWDTTFKALKENVPDIKKRVCPDREFGLGLRLSNTACQELLNPNALNEFKNWLLQENLYVFTLNGFPYGDFHNTVVKDRVHLPDWTTDKRLRYTLDLFDILIQLLPESMDGGISTSPLSYKHWHHSKEAREICLRISSENLAKVIIHLIKLEERTGKLLHLDLEPEPDGLLENTRDVIEFYKEYAFPIIGKILMRELNLPAEKAKAKVKRHLTICYDVCHFALAYENPEFTFKEFEKLGVKIGKIQLSSALSARFKGANSNAIWEALSKFREPVYLHQVTQMKEDGVFTYNDLDEVLEKKPVAEELRAHFHVPLYLPDIDPLFTTQKEVLEVLNWVAINSETNHLEIETYTWDVFPEPIKNGLTSMVSEEFKWVMGNLPVNE